VSLSSEHMMKLMAYADGELEGAERAEVEKLLASDGDAARFVEQVAGLGDFVKVGHDDRDGKAIESFDVADAVMAKVEAEPAAEKGEKAEKADKVVSLAAARQRRGGQARVVGAVVAGLALAASVFLLTRPAETPMGQTMNAPPKPVALNTPKPATSDVPSGPGVEVSAVESPGQTVNVFYVPGSNGLSTSVVVWVDETGEK
jgi:negative regulator of sigma E activity